MKPLIDSIPFDIPENINDCWNVTGKTTTGGYLPICRMVNGKATTFYAHRVVYEIAHGPIPEGKVVCHRCDNTKCVNPDHLFIGSYLDNNHDMMKKGRNAQMLLTNGQVKEVLLEPDWSKAKSRYFADKFCVPITTISRIRRPQTYTWLRRELGLPYETPDKSEERLAVARKLARLRYRNRVGPKKPLSPVVSYRYKKMQGLDDQITDKERAAALKSFRQADARRVTAIKLDLAAKGLLTPKLASYRSSITLKIELIKLGIVKDETNLLERRRAWGKQYKRNRLLKMTPEQLEAHRAKERERRKKEYQELKKDPVRYKENLEMHRKASAKTRDRKRKEKQDEQ